MEQKQLNNVIKVFVFLLIISLGLVYATLTRDLTINGTSKITSKWQIEFTEINEVDKTTKARSIDYNINATTAYFNVELTQPGDYIEYQIKIKNKGTLDAVLDSITRSVNNNEAIIFTISGLKKDDELLAGSEKEITVKVSYAESITSQPLDTIEQLEIELNFKQK